jgi:hypothetical protein
MNNSKTAAKLPQGRVMYQCAERLIEGVPFYTSVEKEYLDQVPVLVLPMPTLAAAKKRLRWERMAEEQKVEAMAWTLYRANNPSSHVPLPSFSKWLKMWQGPRDAETKERAWLRPARQLLSLIQP